MQPNHAVLVLPPHPILLFKEKVEAINSMKHKENMFKNQVDSLIKEGEETIRESIAKHKEMNHWEERFKKLRRNCEDQMEQSEIKINRIKIIEKA